MYKEPAKPIPIKKNTINAITSIPGPRKNSGIKVIIQIVIDIN
ncbi:unnamed protein product, partial [marine sediment metagenome]